MEDVPVLGGPTCMIKCLLLLVVVVVFFSSAIVLDCVVVIVSYATPGNKGVVLVNHIEVGFSPNTISLLSISDKKPTKVCGKNYNHYHYCTPLLLLLYHDNTSTNHCIAVFSDAIPTHYRHDPFLSPSYLSFRQTTHFFLFCNAVFKGTS